MRTLKTLPGLVVRAGRWSFRALVTTGFVASAFLLPGCSVVDAVFTAPDGYGEPAWSAGSPDEPQDPIAANRFELAQGDDVVGEIQRIRARDEDTFVDIARAYGLGYDELVQANPDVDPWLPGAGTTIVLPTRHVLPEAPRRGIVLNVATKRLFYYPPVSAGEPVVVETYPVGIGREGWSTPTGETTVISKARDPVWFVPASIRQEHEEAGDPLPAQVPPGPDNPLGTRVLGLGMPGYLIHGTNKPAGVGMRVSHGCVRLYPEDIESLYERIPVGTEVRLVNQPYLIGWQNGDLLLEAHPPLDEDERDWVSGLLPRARSSLVEYSGPPVEIAAARVEAIAAARLGVPVSVLERGPGMRATIARARWVANIVVHEQLVDSEVDPPEGDLIRP